VRVVPLPYPPLQVEVTTPRLRLRSATDDLLEGLLPVVREGIVRADEMPFDDPISHYEVSPVREWRCQRSIPRQRRVQRDFPVARLRGERSHVGDEKRPSVPAASLDAVALTLGGETAH
jgi:hypothetical protein